MDVTIKTIPHNEQRYETCGDWVFSASGDLLIYISDTGNWKYNALIGVHEVIEALLCKHCGIGQEAVDKFDKEFEQQRKPGNVSEPGDHITAPYRIQHGVASGIERVLASLLNVVWDDYVECLEKL